MKASAGKDCKVLKSAQETCRTNRNTLHFNALNSKERYERYRSMAEGEGGLV